MLVFFFFYHHVLEFNGASLLFLLHEILSGVWGGGRGGTVGVGAKVCAHSTQAEPDHPE